MRFGILGRLRVAGEDGRAVAVTAARQRVLLAALLLSANRVVPAESLAETVWDGATPPGAANTIRSYVMRLRKVLGPQLAARIETRDPGYVVRVEPGELDLTVWEELYARLGAALTASPAAADWHAVAAGATEALGLWREAPLVDVPSHALRDVWLPRLDQQRVQLHEWRIAAGIELGIAHPLLPEINALIQENPLREELYRLSMLGLAQVGRTGEALAVFRQARATLVDQLGVEPGRELARLHRRILSGEIGPAASAPGAAPRTAGRARPPARRVPNQLPNDVRTFVGRAEELARLTAVAEGARHTDVCETVAISVIDGMGGVGKTALAVHAAHGLAAGFPDGRLFVDLRGHTPGLAALTPEDALDWLLRSLDVPPDRIPEGLAERAAFYRDRLDGTRTLILVDNAASAAQVRPLIPAAPGCLVLVTSRSVLSGLDDAHFLGLGLLPADEAVELLAKVAGSAFAADEEAVRELVELCGRLPLAIRIAAAHLRHHPALSVADYVAGLRESADRLEVLSDEDRNLAVVFETSFEELPPAEQRLFGLLGLVPGPDFDAYAAANLLDRDQAEAERLLDSLLTHNLVAQRVPGRYELHDLVRAYALRVGREQEQADAARARLLDFYAQAAMRAEGFNRRTFPHRDGSEEPTLVRVPVIEGQPRGRSWLRAERENVLAAIADARRRGESARSAELTAAISGLLNREGPWQLAIDLYTAAAEAERALGRRVRAANHLLWLGESHRNASRFAEAIQTYEQALTLYREVGERHGEAYTLFSLARCCQVAVSLDRGMEVYEQALRLSRELGDEMTEADTLTALGRLKQVKGEIAESLAMKERAVELFRRLGARLAESAALLEFGRLKARLGGYAEAAELYQASAVIFAELGHDVNQGVAHWELGRARFALGEIDAARASFESSLGIFDAQGYTYGQAGLRWEIGRTEFARGDAVAAVLWHRQALARYRARGLDHGEANVLRELGRARHALGGSKTALLLLDRGLRLTRVIKDPELEAELLNVKGACVAADGDPAAALELYREALRLGREFGAPLEEARALEGTSSCRAALGDAAGARSDLRAAVKLYERMGVAERTAAATRLAEFEGGVGVAAS